MTTRKLTPVLIAAAIALGACAAHKQPEARSGPVDSKTNVRDDEREELDALAKKDADRQAVASQVAAQRLAQEPKPAEMKVEGGMAMSPPPPPMAVNEAVGYVNAAEIAPDAMPQDFNTEAYSHIEETGFKRAADAPLSTFSIDVDTASFANVRRFLLDMGQLPPKDAVRVEEMLNNFRYDDPEPRGDVPFSVTTETASCPWAPDHRLMRVGLRGRSIAPKDLPARNLVFLVDVSGSMDDPNKLPLVKQSLTALAQQLGSRDRVAIVVYAGAAGTVLEPTPGSDAGAIVASLERLQAGGSTNGAEGIQLAYNLANASFIEGGANRVVLCTDGDFNVGMTSQGDLVRLIEQEREKGVFLTVLGFGMGNLKDSTMESLADKGNGNYAYIDSMDEARKVLVEESDAWLVTIAKDVKIQVEMNPAAVGAYRLIGYENRALANEDFNDDRKDAGEIGAGHAVVALYEIVPPGLPVPGANVDALRYQQAPKLTDAAKGGELALVKLRWKAPDGDVSQLATTVVKDSGDDIARASDDLRFAAGVATFGLVLRGSELAPEASFDLALSLAKGAIGTNPGGHREELLPLIERARELTPQVQAQITK